MTEEYVECTRTAVPMPHSKPIVVAPAIPEMVYQGSIGNDCGISTAGFRTGKYNPTDGETQLYNKFYQAFVSRDNSEKARNDAQSTIKETDARSKNDQELSTKNLKERLHDVRFWKGELEREIQDINDITDKLIDKTNRLERALMAAELGLHIVTDNINCRDRRYGVDKVEDEVEMNLTKELDVLNKVQQLIKKTIEEFNKQIKRNRNAKENLDMDWSNKLETEEYDEKSKQLNNSSTNKQFYNGAARYQEIQSTPESWAQHVHDNIVRSEHERMASEQLLTLCANLIQDAATDVRAQADVTDIAFQRRVEQYIDQRNKIKENLKKTCKEIVEQEKNIDYLKKAIRDKEDFLKVNQIRLHNRTFRPGVDLCRDTPQDQLINESTELEKSIDALKNQLSMSETCLKDMHDSRMSLEKDFAMKNNSIFIDKDKCLTHRMRFPSHNKFLGYY